MLPTHERVRVKYIGRNEELSQLNSIFDEVKKGIGKFVLVEGEAGIGKTRLIEEMRSLPNFSGFKFLSGRCLYFKDTDIYLPFKDMYNQYKRMLSGQTEPEASPFTRQETAPEQEKAPMGRSVDDLVPMSLIPAEIEEEEGEEMVVEGILEFDKLSKFIFKLSSEGPLCLFIDDLHWADPPSIKFLQYLAQKIVDHPIMMICTYRPEDLFWGEETAHPLNDPLKRLSRDKVYIPITLKRFSEEETEKLIKNILQIEKVPEQFNKLIFSRTNGNPFFIEEVIYSMIERGILDPTEPDWFQGFDPDTVSLPTTLKDIILRRMHWLKAASINVIRLISVSSGTKITYDIVQEALGMKEEEILESLEELVQAKFLREVREDESYEFENPVIQEVVYSELNLSRRRYLHTKMASVLEKKFPNNPLYWGQIGMHYHKGKDFEKALFYLTRSASHFQRVSPHKALDYLHLVLDCMEKLPQSDAVKAQNMEALIEISSLCLQIGDWTRALEFSEKALNLATVLRQPRSKMRSLLNIGEVCKRRGDYPKALSIFQEIVSSSHEQDLSETLAHAYMGIGYINWRFGDFSRALEVFSKALQYAKVENSMNTIGMLYINIGNVFNHRGDEKKALDYYSRGKKHLETCGNMVEVARAYGNIGNIQISLGDLDGAEKSLETSLEKFKEHGRHDPTMPNLNLVLLRGLQGRYEEAQKVYDQTMDDIKEKDEKLSIGIGMLYLGISRSLAGSAEEAETLMFRAASIFESMGVKYELGRAKYYIGDLYYRLQRFEEAKGFLQEAYQIFKAIGAKSRAEMTKVRLLELRDGGTYI